MLSDIEIKNLPYATASQYVKWDFPCFGVRVGKRTKTFVVKQANRYFVLGRYPNNSLKQCREEARLRLALKYFPSPAIKASEAVDLYMQAKRADHRASSQRLFGTYLKHLRLDLPIDQLTAQMLYEIITPLPPSAGNQAFAVFRAFLNWSVERGYLSANPLHKRKLPHKTKPRQRLLSDAEIQLIWRKTYEHGTFGTILRTLILTAQRINQIKSFRSEWVRDNAIIFPATIMKGKEEHQIPLTAAARKHLPMLNRVFSIDGPMLNKFRAGLGIPHFTPHHFRHYFSSTQAMLKTPIDVTEAILAHRAGSRSAIQRTYDRYNRLEPMRIAYEAFESHLTSIGIDLTDCRSSI